MSFKRGDRVRSKKHDISGTIVDESILPKYSIVSFSNEHYEHYERVVLTSSLELVDVSQLYKQTTISEQLKERAQSQYDAMTPEQKQRAKELSDNDSNPYTSLLTPKKIFEELEDKYDAKLLATVITTDPPQYVYTENEITAMFADKVKKQGEYMSKVQCVEQYQRMDLEKLAESVKGLKGRNEIRDLEPRLRYNEQLDEYRITAIHYGADGGGLRHNKGKAPISLVPTSTIWAIAGVLQAGLEKAEPYPKRNWQRGQAWTIPYECAMRHMMKWLDGEELDEDTGKPHLDLALCNLAFLVEFRETCPELDDRFKGAINTYKTSFEKYKKKI